MKWENPSVGLHNAVLVDVIDKGVQTVEYNGEQKQLHKVRLLWETEEKTSGGRPMMVGRTYTRSLAPRSNLRAALRSWRGKDLSGEETGGVDIDNFIGKPAQVFVASFDSNGEPRVYVDKVLEPLEDEQLRPSGEYTRMQDREGYQPPE